MHANSNNNFGSFQWLFDHEQIFLRLWNSKQNHLNRSIFVSFSVGIKFASLSSSVPRLQCLRSNRFNLTLFVFRIRTRTIFYRFIYSAFVVLRSENNSIEIVSQTKEKDTRRKVKQKKVFALRNVRKRVCVFWAKRFISHFRNWTPAHTFVIQRFVLLLLVVTAVWICFSAQLQRNDRATFWTQKNSKNGAASQAENARESTICWSRRFRFIFSWKSIRCFPLFSLIFVFLSVKMNNQPSKAFINFHFVFFFSLKKSFIFRSWNGLRMLRILGTAVVDNRHIWLRNHFSLAQPSLVAIKSH